MHEVKKPRKPLIYYYVIVLMVLVLVNFLFMPWVAERQIKEVGYEKFMQMTEEEDIGRVEIDQEENQITFTDKDETAIYKTGMVDDPDLTERLYDAGAEFSGQIIEQTSPWVVFLINWILPILILDEATSALDNESERIIQRSLDRLSEGRTCITIAHRLSTVKNSDAILYLENGKIVERGSNDELLKMKGKYYALYEGKAELE